MNKILVFLICLVVTVTGYSQTAFINTVETSSPTTLQGVKGGWISDSGTIISRKIYTDTTAANLAAISLYSQAVIVTSSGGYKMWFRTLNPNVWNPLAIGTIPSTFNPIAGYAILLTGTYPNITFTVDTTSGYVATWALLKKKTDSLNTLISARVKYTDTSSMLTGYTRSGNLGTAAYSDSTTYLRGLGVVNRVPFYSTSKVLTSNINLTYDGTYLNSNNFLTGGRYYTGGSSGGSGSLFYDNVNSLVLMSQFDTAVIQGGNDNSNYRAISFKIGNTWVSKIDENRIFYAVTAVNNAATDNRYITAAWVLNKAYSTTSGTVISVATTDGVGIISSVANSTTTPNITHRVDTVAISTRAWRQKGTDSVMGQVNLKVNISDTSTMLSNRLKISDTLTMLSGYLRTASNGLTKSAQNLVLGGLLNQNTTITDSTFNMLFTNTKKINNTSKYGVNGEFNLIGVTGNDATQVIYAGTYGSMSWASADNYVLHPRGMYSAANGTNYLSNAGSITGTGVASGLSGWLLMSNTGGISNLAGVHIKTPLQQVGATTMTGKVTTYGGVTIDNLRDSSDVQSKFQNMYAIYQKGVNDTSVFNGNISGNTINTAGPITASVVTSPTSASMLPGLSTSAINDSTNMLLARSGNSTYNLWSLVGVQETSNVSTGTIKGYTYSSGSKILWITVPSTGSITFNRPILATAVSASGQLTVTGVTNTANIVSSGRISANNIGSTGGIIYLDNFSGNNFFQYDGTNLVTYLGGVLRTTVNASTGLVTLSNLGTGSVQATAGVLSIISDSIVKVDSGYYKGSAIDGLMKIPKPHYWSFNKESGMPTDGQKVKQFSLFANQVYRVLGEEFAPSIPQTKKDSAMGYTKHSLADRALLSLTIQALQEENKKVESLQSQIDELKAILQRNNIK